MTAEEELTCAIVEQAIADFYDLRRRNVTRGYERKTDSYYSIKEIKTFFNSKWCSNLLASIRCDLTGKDIFDKINRLSGGVTE